MEQIESQLKSQFCLTANTLTQFYMNTLQQNRKAYNQGVKKTLDRLNEMLLSHKASNHSMISIDFLLNFVYLMQQEVITKEKGKTVIGPSQASTASSSEVSPLTPSSPSSSSLSSASSSSISSSSSSSNSICESEEDEDDDDMSSFHTTREETIASTSINTTPTLDSSPLESLVSHQSSPFDTSTTSSSMIPSRTNHNSSSSSGGVNCRQSSSPTIIGNKHNNNNNSSSSSSIPSSSSTNQHHHHPQHLYNATSTTFQSWNPFNSNNSQPSSSSSSSTLSSSLVSNNNGIPSSSTTTAINTNTSNHHHHQPHMNNSHRSSSTTSNHHHNNNHTNNSLRFVFDSAPASQFSSQQQQQQQQQQNPFTFQLSSDHFRRSTTASHVGAAAENENPMKRNYSDMVMADVASSLTSDNEQSPAELHYAFFGAAMPFVPNKRNKTSINSS